MATQADVVAACLETAGIEYIFGVPGSLSSVELIEAASKRGIRYILCSNESSAAAMAGVYSTMRARPGVVSTGVGPGAAAVVHGVAHLYLERSAVLVLTDRYGEPEFRRLPRQRLDHDALFRPITKASFKLSELDAAQTMRRALDLCLDGRPGPVHVDLPYDVMLTEASEADLAQTSRERHRFAAEGGAAGLKAAAEAIEAAQRPAVIVGLQVGRRGIAAEEAFQAFVERLGVPVLASLGAKGTLPEDHALAAGTFRGVASEKALLDQADLIVLVGFDPVEIFTPGRWLYESPVVSIDEVPFTEGPYLPSVEVTGDLTSSLPRLTEKVSRHNGWNREDVDAYNEKRHVALQVASDGLTPQAVIRLTREALPASGILSVDAGQHKVLTSDLWETQRPRGFLSSSGLGTMAVSLPAAIAAKLVEPESPVVCFTGDGGFLMRTGDLETAVREQLPIIVVVFNDHALTLVKLQQDRRGVDNLGVSFTDCDFAAIARGFGLEARRVDTEPEFADSMREAVASGRPWLIDARIDPVGYS